jgi:hypothetical protein
VAHVGKAGWKDWNVLRHACENDFVLVTNNAADFRKLYAEEPLHAGLNRSGCCASGQVEALRNKCSFAGKPEFDSTSSADRGVEGQRSAQLRRSLVHADQTEVSGSHQCVDGHGVHPLSIIGNRQGQPSTRVLETQANARRLRVLVGVLNSFTGDGK